MSIKVEKIVKEIDQIQSITCSKCKKTITHDDFIEWQEMQSIVFTGGYGSRFGDGSTIRIDLCQECLYDLTKNFYEVVEG